MGVLPVLWYYFLSRRGAEAQRWREQELANATALTEKVNNPR
jgi:hypothetical protein